MDPQKIKMTPKDFFMQLGLVVALYVSVISLLALVFQIINVAFPDALQNRYYYDPYSSAIRWAIASLIIVFPVFLGLSSWAVRTYGKIPEKKNLPLRRWLMYFTLFVAGIVIAVDLIVLINTFLGGEITARFILKVVAVFVVAGLVFGYFILDLKDSLTRAHRRNFFGVSVTIILGSIIVGFILMGSPQTQRKLRFDAQKVQDLQEIQWRITDYYGLKAKLPATLEEIDDPLAGGSVVKIDPQTNDEYVYRVKGPLTFELCADFNFSSEEGKSDSASIAYPVGYGYIDENWTHGVGNHCFERTIDPEKLPPRKGI